MKTLLPMGLAIDQDIDSKVARSTDKRGYIDSDIPLLESFGILKNGNPPSDFYLSPEDYREFINWLLEGSITPVPSIPLKILCYYRTKLSAGMQDIGTTNGNRLYQENIIKTINKMIGGDDDQADPSIMCASGGAAQPHPPDSGCCEEIMPKIDSISEALDELKNKAPFDIKVELQKLLSGSTDSGSGKDYSEQLGEIKNLIEGQKGCNSDEIVEKIRELLPSTTDNVSKMDALSSKVDSLSEGLRSLTTVITGTLATEIGETNEATKSILEKLGEARENISKLVSNKPNTGKSSLEIRAVQITERAEKASQEAEKALAELNAVKKNNTKSADEIEEAVEKATDARDSADKLIAEAQMLWELIEPSQNNSSSSSAEAVKGPEGPIVTTNAKVEVLPNSAEKEVKKVNEQIVANKGARLNGANSMVGGRGSAKNHQTINAAKSKLNELTASVTDARSIIKARRKSKVCNTTAKNAEISSLKEQIAASEAELVDLRNRTGGDKLEQAQALESKVQSLTALIKKVTGETNDLEKGIDDHLATDKVESTQLEELQAKIAGIPDIDELKEKLQAAIEKIDTLEKGNPGSNSEIVARLTAEVEAASAKHEEDEQEKARLNAEIVRINTLLEPLQAKYDELSAKSATQQSEIDEKAAEISRLKTQDLENRSGDSSGLEIELESKKRELRDLTESFEETLKDKAAALRELAAEKEEIAALREQLAGEKAERAEEKTRLEEELERVNGLLDSLQREKLSLEAKLTEKSSELESALGNIEGQKTRIAELESGDADKESKELASMQERFRALTDEKARIAEELSSKEAEIISLTASLQEAKASLSVYKTGASDKNTALEEIQGRLEAALRDAAEQRHLSQIAERDRKALEAQLEELTRRADQVAEEAKSMRGRNSSALSNIQIRLSSIKAEKERLAEDLKRSMADKAAADERANQAAIETDNARREAASLQNQLAAATRDISNLRTKMGQVGDAQRDLEGLRSQIQQVLADKAAISRGKEQSNAVALGQQKRAEVLQVKYDTLLASQGRAHKDLESKLKTAESSVAQLSAQVQASGKDRQELDYAEQELQQLRLESQQLKLALRDCGTQEHRLDLSPQFNERFEQNVPGKKALPAKGIPSYMQPTASKISRNAVTQKQLDAQGKGRYARGGKKGARLTKAKKRISPLI